MYKIYVLSVLAMLLLCVAGCNGCGVHPGNVQKITEKAMEGDLKSQQQLADYWQKQADSNPVKK